MNKNIWVIIWIIVVICAVIGSTAHAERAERGKIFELLEEFEGYRERAYQCPADVWTIGYGTTGRNVSEGDTINEKDAWALSQAYIVTNINPVIEGLEKERGEEFTRGQRAALQSLAYNIGQTRFRQSRTYARLAEKSTAQAMREWLEWRLVNGEVSHGLIRRRQAEVQLYLRSR